MAKTVYIRLKQKIHVPPNKPIHLAQIAHISAEKDIKDKLLSLSIPTVQSAEEAYAIIEAFTVANVLHAAFSDIKPQFFGPTATIVEFNKAKNQPAPLLVIFVWLVLFVGTAMTLINFHYDVSMPEVQQQLHYWLTGEYTTKPLLLQIPYAFGLGVGMVLYLNHWFKKKFNDEPSPLELELYKYKRDIDEYLIDHEHDV